MKKYYIRNGRTIAVPRVTGHQQYVIACMHDTEQGVNEFNSPMRAKSWTNDKGKKVWSFVTEHWRKLVGDVWDGQTGESLLRKGIIEPSFIMRHGGGYPHHPAGRDIQFYRLTDLGQHLAKL